MIPRQESVSCYDMVLKLKHINCIILNGREFFFSRDVVFNKAKIGFEQESINKDSDTEFVPLECSNEQHNSECSHEEEEQESPQIEEPEVTL